VSTHIRINWGNVCKY